MTDYGRVGDVALNETFLKGSPVSLLRSLAAARAVWIERQMFPVDTIAPAVIPYWVLASYAQRISGLQELPLSEQIDKGVPRLWTDIENLGLALTVERG